MAVTVDVAAILTPGSNAQTSQSYTNPITVGVTANALVVALTFVAHVGGTSTSPTATWDGVSMSLLSSFAGNEGDMFLFGLRSPNTGAKVLAFTWTGSNQSGGVIMSVIGADTSSDAAAFINKTTANGANNTNSLAITNSASAVALAAHLTNGNYTPGGGGGTDIGNNNTGNLSSEASNYSTSSNPTLTYTSGGSVWSSIGLSIAPPGAGGFFARYYYDKGAQINV